MPWPGRGIIYSQVNNKILRSTPSAVREDRRLLSSTHQTGDTLKQLDLRIAENGDHDPHGHDQAG